MTFLVFMIVASLVLLVAYALKFHWMRVVIARWLFVIEVWNVLFYIRWKNQRTADSFLALQKREGVVK